jgi:hypothetical protein
LLVKPHSLLDDKSEDGATGQACDATGIKPIHLLWRELHGKRV